MSSDKRPNLIIFTPDELRTDAVGCMGNSIIKTPNIDNLGRDGVVFTNAFTVNPVCGPARCAIFTGHYPHVSGHRSLYYLLQPHEESILKFLKNSGYHVQMIGRNDLFAKKAFKEHTSKRSRGFSKIDLKSFTKPPEIEERLKKSFYFGKRADEPVKDYDYSIIQEALKFLDSNPPEPFCLFVALAFPHPPYTIEEPYYSMYDKSKIPLPISPKFDDKPHFMKEMYDSYNLKNLTDDDKKELIATYYGMISRLDDQFGLVAEKLKEKGYYDKSSILFFSDHGDYTGDYGLTEKWSVGFQDCLLKIPLIIKLPEGIAKGTVKHNLIENIDLFPTMADIANIQPEYTHFGKSLISLMKDETDKHRDAIFAEGGYNPREPQCFEAKIKDPDQPMSGIYYDKIRISYDDPTTVARAAMIRTNEWKFVSRSAGKEELYNLLLDPQEQTNLIDDNNFQQVQEEMKEKLLKWYINTSDNAPTKKERAL